MAFSFSIVTRIRVRQFAPQPRLLSRLLAGLAIVLTSCTANVTAPPLAAPTQPPSPPVAAPVEGVPLASHVVVAVFENTSYDQAMADTGFRDIAARGALLRRFYAVGHSSLPNYLALTSGAEPTARTSGDCPFFNCPVTDINLGNRLDSGHDSWKGYFEGTQKPCAVPAAGQQDPYTRGYMTRHNPFAYYPNIGGDPQGGNDYCNQHLRPFGDFLADAANGTLPIFSMVIPDSCHSGHDRPCAGGTPGGLAQAVPWMNGLIGIASSARGWDRRSLLILLFDESTDDDKAGCCAQPGGGHTAAVMIAGTIKPGVTSDLPGDHYSMLRTIEDALQLPGGHLGQAVNRKPFADIFESA